MKFSNIIISVLLAFMPFFAMADDVTVAVASNFSAPMHVIAKSFEQDTGYKINLVFGSSGKFYSQISHGAPFDVLLSADTRIPRELEISGQVVKGSIFTYALGRIALWSTNANLIKNGPQSLKDGQFNKLAIANPTLAPYGQAATDVLKNLGLDHALKNKLIQGENIAQTFHFVASGNADLGIVSLSQIVTGEASKKGSRWIIPTTLYHPIRQDAALLSKGKANLAATSLLSYLKTPKVREIIERFGYRVPQNGRDNDLY